MKNKVKNAVISKPRKIFQRNSYAFSLKFFFVTFLIFLKMALEIIIRVEFDWQNGLFIIISLISQIVFLALFLFMDFRFTKKSPRIPKFLKCLCISTAVLLEFFLIIFYRTQENVEKNENYKYKVAQVFWDSQTLCLFFAIFSEKFTPRQKTMLFLSVNSLAMLLFIIQNQSPTDLCLLFLNFLPNAFLFLNLKGFFKIFELNEPNLEEICGLMYQGFLILSRDSYEILYISSKFSSTISKLKTIKDFDDVNNSLRDLEEEKILVDKSDDQHSVIASINRQSISHSNSHLSSRYKTKTNLLNTSKYARIRSKFKKLKDLLDSSKEKYDLFLEKNVIRTYLGYNSAGELKGVHIRNVQYKKNLAIAFI